MKRIVNSTDYIRKNVCIGRWRLTFNVNWGIWALTVRYNSDTRHWSTTFTEACM
jgi:hypothetical protein